MLRKLILATVTLATALSVGLSAGTASAATNPWTWTDISSQVEHRTQRPVWAMAYASPYWFYTDGLELWDGGQVYRTEGTVTGNVTLDVRNAGLSRVDEIVTDGRTVVFLKNVFRLDNTVEAVAYRDGVYRNITAEIRKPLDSNEGISSIVGKNGTWVAVTTRARLVKYSETLGSYTRITMPSEIKTLYSSDASLLYSAHDRYDRGNDTGSYAGIAIAPVGSKFLIAVDNRYHTSGYLYTNFYTYDGSYVSSIVRPDTTVDDVYTLSSNGSMALLVAEHLLAAGNNGAIYTYDGASWSEVVNDQWFWNSGGSHYPRESTFPDRSNFKISWNGTRWSIVSGQDLYQIHNNTFEKIGPMRDYFITSASNGAGTTLMGGAVSVLGNTQPVFPLNAKLVRVIENYVSVPSTPTTPSNPTATGQGISAWQWLDPNAWSVRRDQSFTYTVQAQHANGLNRAEIWVNGTVRKTCTLAQTSANQTCSITLSGYEFSAPTQVAINAKIVGRDGEYQQLWTPLTYMQVVETSSYTPSTYVPSTYSINAWQGFDNGVSSIRRDQTATYTVTSQHPYGLSRAEIYVNGILRKTCALSATSANQWCSIPIYGHDYAAGSTVSVNAKIVGRDGEYQQLWTPTVPLWITEALSSVTTPSAAPSTWVWSSPANGTTVADKATYSVGAWDANGIRRIDIWVNGSVRRTCTYADATTNVSCAWDLYA
ncbi:Ig-like domain-containing protein, partial [Candidatus Uhrbacteria bacterium]|nr:Ig-like domain-containing protein [Candidatus Uhrbacteria bacterium]